MPSEIYDFIAAIALNCGLNDVFLSFDMHGIEQQHESSSIVSTLIWFQKGQHKN